MIYKNIILFTKKYKTNATLNKRKIIAATVAGISTFNCFLLYKKIPPKQKIRKISEIAICKIKDNSVKYNKNIVIGMKEKNSKEESKKPLLFLLSEFSSNPLPSVYKVSK